MKKGEGGFPPQTAQRRYNKKDSDLGSGTAKPLTPGFELETVVSRVRGKHEVNVESTTNDEKYIDECSYKAPKRGNIP